MEESESEIWCEHCERNHIISRLNGGDCPDCGEQLLFYPGPSRGTGAEMLANRRAEAGTEEEKDVCRMYLHLLACNLLTKHDIFHFLAMGNITDHVQHVLEKAIDNAESVEGGDVLVCPNCETTIESYARWYMVDEAT